MIYIDINTIEKEIREDTDYSTLTDYEREQIELNIITGD